MPENYQATTEETFRYALLSQMEDLNLNLGNIAFALDRIADTLEAEEMEIQDNETEDE